MTAASPGPAESPDPLQSQFQRDGFVVLREFLPADQFLELRRELERYIRDVVPTLHDSHAFYEDRARPETLKQLQHMSVDPYFAAYVDHPAWRGLAARLLGEPVTPISAAEWFNKPAGTEHPTPAHQDNYYFNLEPAQVLTLWLALEDVDEENGCLRYVPGSHHHGRLAHNASRVLGFSQGLADFSEELRAREVAVPLHANDLVAHHGWTIHRAEPNRSAVRHRPSFAIAYRAVRCRVDEQASQAYRERLKQQHEALGLATDNR